jgi:hypothetical protein
MTAGAYLDCGNARIDGAIRAGMAVHAGNFVGAACVQVVRKGNRLVRGVAVAPSGGKCHDHDGEQRENARGPK